MARPTKDDAAAQSEIWKQIDLSLVRLKLSQIGEEMDRIEQQHLAHLRLRNSNNRTVLTDLDARMEALALRVDEEVKQVYQAFCEVWTSQAKAEIECFYQSCVPRRHSSRNRGPL